MAKIQSGESEPKLTSLDDSTPKPTMEPRTPFSLNPTRTKVREPLTEKLLHEENDSSPGVVNISQVTNTTLLLNQPSQPTVHTVIESHRDNAQEQEGQKISDPCQSPDSPPKVEKVISNSAIENGDDEAKTKFRDNLDIVENSGLAFEKLPA